MAENVKPRIKAPATAKKGEVFEVKTLIQHEMESGQRKDKDGKIIPRQIINKFTCTLNGKPVITLDLEPAISANPYIVFSIRATESGTLEFKWMDDNGAVYSASHNLTVN